MKRFLKKRWHRIPVAIVSAVLALSLITGGVLASYLLFMGNANVTVVEAFTFQNTTGDFDEAYTWSGADLVWDVVLSPGEVKTLNILVSNASTVALNISATSSGGESGVTGVWSGLGTVTGGGNAVITLTVTAAEDAPPGGQAIYLEIYRG